MIVTGCDVGAIDTKTVALKDGELIGWNITSNQGKLGKAAKKSLDILLEKIGLQENDIQKRCGTGWGGKYIGYDHQKETMINCLARGARFLWPTARTVVDLGGLSTTVIHIGPEGKVQEYRTNDRCASGTGFFLDLAAQALEIDLNDVDRVVETAQSRAYIGAQCAVFGESEIVSHVNDGVEAADIMAGLAHSLGTGAATMVRRLGAVKDILVTGGVARVDGVIRAMEEKLGETACRPELDPALAAALGAALSVMNN